MWAAWWAGRLTAEASQHKHPSQFQSALISTSVARPRALSISTAQLLLGGGHFWLSPSFTVPDYRETSSARICSHTSDRTLQDILPALFSFACFYILFCRSKIFQEKMDQIQIANILYAQSVSHIYDNSFNRFKPNIYFSVTCKPRLLQKLSTG